MLDDDMPVAAVEKELSVHYNTRYRWVSEYEEHGESAFPGMEAMRSEADMLEILTDKSYWTYPTYSDLLFYEKTHQFP